MQLCIVAMVIRPTQVQPSMFFIKLFRKSLEFPPRFKPEAELAENLARRVSAIEFRPSRGFLKDQKQPKRSEPRTA